MLTTPTNSKIFLVTETVDFRMQLDSLKWYIEEYLKKSSYRCYFLFFSKNRKALRVVYYDDDSMCMFWKRLNNGTFQELSMLSDIDKEVISISRTTCKGIVQHKLKRKIRRLE